MVMDPIQLLLLVLVGAGAGFVQRVSGFGLGIFSMLFLPYMFPTHTAAATIPGLFSCGTSTYNAIRHRKQIPYKTVLPMLAAALVMIPVAVHFAARISGDFFQILLGIVLIGLSVYFLFFDSRVHLRPTLWSSLLAGGLGGALNGLFSTGGPPAVLYMTHATTDKISYFAGIQFYFCVTNIYATAVRFMNGLLTVDLLVYAAVGFVGCMVGNFIGGKVFDRLDGKKLKRIIYIGMIASGVLMIL